MFVQIIDWSIEASGADAQLLADHVPDLYECVAKLMSSTSQDPRDVSILSFTYWPFPQSCSWYSCLHASRVSLRVCSRIESFGTSHCWQVALFSRICWWQVPHPVTIQLQGLSKPSKPQAMSTLSLAWLLSLSRSAIWSYGRINLQDCFAICWLQV